MIAASSDWHWGDGTASDCACYCGAQAILDDVLGKVDALALCGDWLDFWRSSPQAVLAYQERRLRRLAQRLRSSRTPLYWVLGNHDWGDPGEWARALAPYGLTSPFLTVCTPSVALGGWTCIHGCQLGDKWNNPASPLFGIAHGLTRGSAWVKANLWPGLDESRLDPTKWISGQRGSIKKLLKSSAVNWAADQRVHVAYGHTHDLGEVQGDDVSGGFHAVNVGCASRGRAAYALLGDDGTATLHPLMGSF